MKMINGDYIQSRWVDAILIRENVNTENDYKSCKDSNYYVLHKEELFQLKFEEINHLTFIQVPGIRLIETIEAQAEVIVNNQNGITYLEMEKDTKYILNLTNILRVEKIDTQVWKFTMTNDVYYFKAFAANINIFLNRLIA